MKHRLTSLRLRILLPVIGMVLLVVILLNVMFSLTYIRMILQQEQEVNATGFETVSRSITPLIETALSTSRRILLDERVASYARHRYDSDTELIHARISCRDFLRTEAAKNGNIYGLLVMRKDGSLFGTLPEGNFFWDDPKDNPFPDTTREQIMNVPFGDTVWIGPIKGADIYGFESDNIPRSIMLAAWKTNDVKYGAGYGIMLMDEKVFDELFSSVKDEKSTWHLFSENKTEIYHTGEENCTDPDELINESNKNRVVYDEDGHPFSSFSETMEYPAWTLIRKVSMEAYESVVRRVRWLLGITGALIILAALGGYHMWLRKILRQYNSLLNGIVRMGEGDLESTTFVPTTIDEFLTMQQEINRTRLALSRQMDTIREMEREHKEQEIMARELSLASKIQLNALPHTFPPFPERKEIELYASMTPARDVGGDFYDYFFIDEDHLCLLIADVSGKGVPAALFMMAAKRILEDSARTERGAGGILEETNRILYESDQEDMFVTVWLGILEISTGKLTAANAGHEYPTIGRQDTGFELYKDRHGFVLGGMEGVHYRAYDIQLNPGDKIFVYTDGVPEATALDNEMFGTERMVAALNDCKEGGPEEILCGVKRAVDAFVGDAEQFDDLTMLCLEYRGGSYAGFRKHENGQE